MYKLYSISLVTLFPKHNLLDVKLTDCDDDWIRFNYNQWFVWSKRSKTEISETAKSILTQHEQCIVLAISTEAAQGAAPPWIWEWLNEKMTKQMIGF